MQDYKPVIIRNPAKQKVIKSIIEKKGDMSNIDHMRKIENETDNFTIQKIPSLLSREIINARIKLKHTQKDVSNKLCIQLNVYTDIENGKAIYSNETKQIINKLERVFGLKFENKKVISP